MFTSHIAAALRASQVLRLCLLGLLTLILLIPVSMIRGLVAERQGRNQEAIAEVSSKWGNTQVITGPALILPHTVRWIEKSSAGQDIVRTDTRNAVFLPRRLQSTGRLNVESRSRGIFDVPVYTLQLAVEGEFGKPALAELGINPGDVLWERAHLVIGISDVRAIREQPALSWNGASAGFLPGTSGFREAPAGIHAPVHAAADDSVFRFSFPLSLNGSISFYTVPFAEDTAIQLSSNSQYPNFQGNWLPAERTVDKSGFNATWRISYLGRNYPQAWISGQNMTNPIEQSRFGVELAEPVDQYRMADRSVKYASLFILLTFASIWLVEVLAGLRVHPIQYLMIGGALCVFYLLELSLSEHIRFAAAYGIASIAIVAMIAGYTRAILQRSRRAVVVASGVGVLYGYLFVLLTNEDAALLVGSIGLFVFLAGVMFVTRGVRWGGALPAETSEPIKRV